MAYLIISILLVGAAIVLSYLSRWEGVAASLAALCVAYWGRIAAFASSAFGIAFWIVAAVIAIGITVLLPREVKNSKVGLPFLATGALVGAILGMLLNSAAGIILGVAIGIALGALAFGSMAAGKEIGFPSKKYFNYVLAKGFPLLISYSMIGILLAQFISN